MAGPVDGAATPDADGRVALVVVSHSRPLAEAAVVLARQMVHGPLLSIEVAAGVDEGGLGTDATGIRDAILRADGPAGTVVLMDLGSALISTELALDVLPDPLVRDRVTLSPAPLVEGLVVAAVAAAGGATRAEVAAEAERALLGKQAHLAVPPQADGGALPVGGSGVVDVFTVANAHGLHARPAARLVGEVRGLDAVVRLRNLTIDGPAVPASGLSRVATIGALRGHRVEVSAVGRQARQAVDRVLALARSGFDEEIAERAEIAEGAGSPAVPGDGPLPASPGIAIGPARRLVPAGVVPAAAPHGRPQEEWQQVLDAVDAVRRQVEELRVRTERTAGPAAAGVFAAHLSLLSDGEMLADVESRISAGDAAAEAWAATVAAVAEAWSALPDPYLSERAADVRAVGDQVLAALTGAPARRMSGPGVLVAENLTPAETAALDADDVAGVVLAHGSPTSHAAILARARGIPVVVAAGPSVLGIPDGHTVVLDGTSGELHVDPPAELVARFRARAGHAAEVQRAQLTAATEPATSRDGVQVTVSANLGSLADARAATASGADGAGLVRTEFLFLDRAAAPDVEEQRRVYQEMSEVLGGRRMTVRTLDVGGDKPLAYAPIPVEANPFLGQRGVRLALQHRDLLRDQAAAVCQVARTAPVHVMVPMVSTPDEVTEFRALLAEAAGPDALPSTLHVGMMVEVPSAALKLEAFLPQLDFVSIGTNDLTQYAMAAERGNAAVAGLADPLDPGVLRLVSHVCRVASGRIDVAVCGEAASDRLAVPLLVGLGVRELSVSPPAVPRIKAQVRELDVRRCAVLAGRALDLGSADEVRRLVSAHLADPDGAPGTG